jgi:hypothetical protein
MAKRTCVIESCDKPHLSRGWCSVHYQRWWKYGDPLFKKKRRRRRVHPKDGYARIYVGDDRVLEHRHVYEQHLGRPLLREETLHHINGVRNDNRLENLELWVGWGRQPKGQRVSDLIAFVVEHYPKDVAALLRKQSSNGKQSVEHPALW